ncbi:MAG TPA: hypothetical protein VFQ39_16685, partial [Longimicrobium sp.]|nr:hypothetical protein [Longimicrobium sp.]
MRVHQAFTLAAALAAISCGGPEDQPGATGSSGGALVAQGRREPPMLGIHWARGQGQPAPSSPLMTWHQGEILTTTAVQPIFWGTSWSNPTFVGQKITGLADFYSGVGGSRYAGTNTEYTGTNGQVSATISSAAAVVDLSAAPTGAPKTSAILAEVCSAIANPVPNGFYPVYVDQPRGHQRYCAWHSYGTCNGVPIEFGFFFWLDGDPGCNPQDTWTSHSEGLAALANVSGHEISETATDPSNGGWWDSSGQEN